MVNIEPLVSFLRHPLYFCPPAVSAVDFLDRSYLHLPLLSQLPDPLCKKWFFDAGATIYDTGTGASQSWFIDSYRNRGIEFDRIIGWEAVVTDPVTQWNSVPADIKTRTSWFNIPATFAPDDADNPLFHIKQLTKPEDYVVFKLDIDNPVVEIELVQQIMGDPELLLLIDEFFFEHHVSGSPMQWCCWGDLRNNQVKFGTLPESYEIFTFFRKNGIRAHSWV